MNRIVIYHGSDHIIEKPLFGYGEAHNDYGLGFYCTLDLELAKEWANRSTTNGFANKYLFDARTLKVLDLTKEEYSVLNWIAILLHHRHLSLADQALYKRRLDFLDKYFYIDVSQYDVVVGYRADDTYFKFPMFFLRNEFSVNRLEEIYKLGNLGKQIVLISEKAFSHLEYIGFVESEPIYKEKYHTRKNQADVRFEEMLIEDITTSSVKIEDLMKQYDYR